MATLGALRLGKLDVAIGNLLGSNLCNVMILAVDDAVYVRRTLLADAAIMAVAMTGLLIIGLAATGTLCACWISVALAAAYAINAALVYLGGV
jgi:cation:H+ antiporter